MKQSTRIAKDMFDKCGALVSITDIAKYFGISANTARRIVAGVPPISQGTGKRYYYEEVAEAVVRY